MKFLIFIRKRILAIVIMFCINQVHAGELKILSYNVENLFDPSHATPNKDWAFMPKSHPKKSYYCSLRSRGINECLNTDWTEEKYNQKIDNLVKVIKSYESLPEMLALIEIEEENVISKIAKELNYENYKITHSPDTRGINVGLLFNTTDQIKYINSNEHTLNVSKPTRNILEVEFTVNSTPLIIFVNHWPSQANPVSDRIKTANFLKNLINQKLIAQPTARIVTLGDFNTTEKDRPDPFDAFIRTSTNPLFDVQDLYLKSKDVSSDKKKQQPLSSYFFGRDMSWVKLDRFFINKNLLSNEGLHAVIDSFLIHAPNFSKSTYAFNENANYSVNKRDSRYGSLMSNTPIPSNIKTDDLNKIGYSDHFPIALKLSW